MQLMLEVEALKSALTATGKLFRIRPLTVLFGRATAVDVNIQHSDLRLHGRLHAGRPSGYSSFRRDHHQEQRSSIGSSINSHKCEIISHSPIITQPQFDSFRRLRPDEATLLGTPLSTGTAL
jgi:hypothetical protein